MKLSAPGRLRRPILAAAIALCAAAALLALPVFVQHLAGYHRRDDLWRIPAWISSLDLDYRLRFRIHAHNSFDAVFYAY